MPTDEVTGRLLDDCLELAKRVRAATLPLLGSSAARTTVGTAVGGDATMAIDKVAEEVVADFAESTRYSFYTEDAGLVEASSPRGLLVVDPVDGTRPAAAGFESACVSIAATTRLEEPTIADVVVGVVQELKAGTTFVATADGRSEIVGENGSVRPPNPSDQSSLDRMFWAGGFRGRPYLPIAAAVAPLADRCSIEGSTFDLGSASYIMTRLVTGQLDAYVDPGLRVLEQFPQLEAEFLRAGRGSVVCNAPYDVAAALLCAVNAGCVVTDAWGRSLRSAPLLGSGRDRQVSVVAAANRSLHGAIMAELDRTLEQMNEIVSCILSFSASLHGDR